MHSSHLLSCSALLALLALPSDLEAQRGRGRRSMPTELEHFTVRTETVEVESLRRGELTYAIYLPKSYSDQANSDRKYPLAIWLHGMNGDYRRFGGGGGATVLDQLRGADKIPEMIVVTPSASRQTCYMNGERSGDIEDLITKDLVKHLEAKYRIADEPSKRAILGISIGGLGAMKIALKYPEQFGAAATVSAAFFPADPDEMQDRMFSFVERRAASLGISELVDNKKKWRSEMPAALVADKPVAQLQNVALYFNAGGRDRYGFGPPNQALHNAMKQRGLRHAFDFYEDGGHAWGSSNIPTAVGKALQFVGTKMRGKDPLAASGENAEPAPKPTEKGGGVIR